MAEASVRIVTDGSIELSPEAVRQGFITVVPCLVRARRKEWQSNGQMPLALLRQEIGRVSGVHLIPPDYSDFLQTYRQLADSSVISIHAAAALGEPARAARLARNLLPLKADVTLFEALTIDAGVAFLVEAAAQAAQHGCDAKTVKLMLQRIQDEALRTYIVTADASQLAPLARLSDWRQRFRLSLPGVEGLFMVDKDRQEMRLVAQGWGLARSLPKRTDLFEGFDLPCDAQIVHRGYSQVAQALAAELPGILKSDKVKVREGSLGMTPYVRGKYLAVIVQPTAQAVERIEKFAQRMTRLFGA